MDDVAVVYAPVFLQHLPPSPHPENPGRLTSIYSLFEEERFQTLPNLSVERAAEQQLINVHAREMVECVKAKSGERGWVDPDTYFSSESVRVAELAAGSCIALALAIWEEKYRRGFSFVRPPGHHATRLRSMGFCLFNNIALAASAVLEMSPKARLAIVDFDCHHGNGTQDIFYRDPRILFISSHRYPFYPGTGDCDEIGEGTGKGTKINFPLGKAYGDDFFVSLYSQLVYEMCLSFKPDMIFVSAGFDGHILDPMQGFRIHSETYGILAEILISAAERVSDGKIFFCLEGGYSPQGLKESSKAVLEKLMGLDRTPFDVERRDSRDPAQDSFRSIFRPLFPGVF